MPRIAEETLQQVLAATDIVDLIGRVVKLRRSGTNYLGLCPFHQEKTPSFNVNPARNTYHCFGCGAGGNAFRFVMEHDGLTFVEAVKRLAETAGIRIEEEVFDANAERSAKERQALLRVHKEIAEWYHMLLLRHRIAEPARAYLKSRGITAETAKNWQMGYAPGSGDILREWALERKFSEQILVDAGILARGDEDSARPGETYPRFRQRLMFPIRNADGAVIAFSGRMLDPSAKTAKYLNSPETPIFSKSKVLFGLDKSHRAIRKANRAIVCEGQIDVIMVFESGVENVVAPLGTAFTDFHARMLKRHAEEIVLCFDADTAGYKAAVRAFTILAPSGLIVKVAPLPQGEDPDSLIRKQGTEVFRQNIASARDFFDHMIDFASSTRNFSDTREKTAFAGEMAGLIRLLDNTIASDAAIQKVAVRLDLPEHDYRRQVARTPKPVVGTGPQEGSNGSATHARPALPPQDQNAFALCRYALADENILGWLRHTGRSEICRDIPGCEVLALIWQGTSNLSDPATLNAYLSTLSREEEAAFSLMLSRPTPPGGLPEAEVALARLEDARMDNLVERITTQLKQPGLDQEKISELRQRLLALRLERDARRKS
jgi:DNA primase